MLSLQERVNLSIDVTLYHQNLNIYVNRIEWASEELKGNTYVMVLDLGSGFWKSRGKDKATGEVIAEEVRYLKVYGNKQGVFLAKDDMFQAENGNWYAKIHYKDQRTVLIREVIRVAGNIGHAIVFGTKAKECTSCNNCTFLKRLIAGSAGQGDEMYNVEKRSVGEVVPEYYCLAEQMIHDKAYESQKRCHEEGKTNFATRKELDKVFNHSCDLSAAKWEAASYKSRLLPVFGSYMKQDNKHIAKGFLNIKGEEYMINITTGERGK